MGEVRLVDSAAEELGAVKVDALVADGLGAGLARASLTRRVDRPYEFSGARSIGGDMTTARAGGAFV
jgi:hypothetical protein